MSNQKNLELAQRLAKTIADQLPDGTVTSVKPGALRQRVRCSGYEQKNVVALWVQQKLVHVLIPNIVVPGVETKPDRLGTPKHLVNRAQYSQEELIEYFEKLGKKIAGVISGDASFSKIFERDNHRCVYCGRDLLHNYDAFALAQIDHLKPTSKGGSATDIMNTVMSCCVCNKLKSDFLPEGSSREEQIKSARLKIYERRAAKINDEYSSWFLDLDVV